MTDPTRRFPRYFWLLIAGVVVVALLPWWRNHHYLRDLYDYGLVIAGIGLMEKGQHPYVDFATPIQAGFFGLSWLVEKIGGSSYLALTRGGAGLIVAMGTAFMLILARRWPWWASVVLALAVTTMSASQHTILWHNSLGVFYLGVVVWSAALHPVWRRTAWPWHLLVAAGLFLGGINKMNFHLVALAAALAWALRAGFNRQAGWRTVMGTCMAWLLAGTVLPVAAEMAWTGATWELWRHNVIELAVGSRAQTLRDIFQWKFLRVPIHDYYGPLLVPQVGLAGIILTLATLAGCWPARDHRRSGSWDPVLLPLATVLSAGAGAALLATNQEIAYLGLGAWLVLLVGVWLGFGESGSRWHFAGGLVLPAFLLGTVAWISAWQGQRSQFGYSDAPRSAYQPAEKAGAAYAYMSGLRLPPEFVTTITLMERWLAPAQPHGMSQVFYGAGLEWVQRFLPGLRQPGQPLWVHWDTTYGAHEAWRLLQAIGKDTHYQVVMTLLARQEWLPEIALALDQYFFRDPLGPLTMRWNRRHNITEYVPDSIDFINRAGGNVAGPFLRTEAQPPVHLLPFGDHRIMLGVMAGQGVMVVSAPSYRFGGDAVLERSIRGGSGPLYADFQVIVHGADPENVRWSSRVELPAGQWRVVVPFMFDSLGGKLQLRVSVPDQEFGMLFAGYSNLQINHAIESAGNLPRLRIETPQDSAVTPEWADRLLSGLAWRPAQLVVRGGQLARDGLEVAAGGEVWLHTDGMTGELQGKITCPTPAGARPMVRVVWYKGGRLQILQQGQIPAGRPFEFRAWCAEPGGWIGVMLDPGAGISPAMVQITAAKIAP